VNNARTVCNRLLGPNWTAMVPADAGRRRSASFSCASLPVVQLAGHLALRLRCPGGPQATSLLVLSGTCLSRSCSAHCSRCLRGARRFMVLWTTGFSWSCSRTCSSIPPWGAGLCSLGRRFMTFLGAAALVAGESSRAGWPGFQWQCGGRRCARSRA